MEEKCYICGRTNVKTFKTNYNNKSVFMCQKHQHQWYEKGEITDSSPYSIQDGTTNEYIEYDTYYEIILRKCTEGHKEVGRAIVDKDDYERCKDKRWRISSHTRKNGKTRIDVMSGSPSKNNTISLHQFIIKAEKGDVVDHKDGNTLNNRKSNLRKCTQKENVRNKTVLQSNNTSGILGVYKDSRKEHKTNWIAEIRYNDIKIYLCAYINLEDAVYCRYYAEKLLFKEFRPTTYDKKIKPYIDKCLNKEQIEKKVEERIKSKVKITD